MGLAISDLIVREEVKLDDLKHKTFAVDSFNLLYQFLATIRGPDGTSLTDTSGNVTSHLVGLFSRVSNLMQKDMKFVFVFDGKAPDLKLAERKRRRELKEEAQKEYEIAKQREDLVAMRKYASRTTSLTKEMIEESKELVRALGFPFVQAPSEGEAQAAKLVTNGDVYAAVSQDYDTLLYNVPKLVRNLSITGRRQKAGTYGYKTIQPELISSSSVLNQLGIDNDQLIALSMLVGTDYNPKGIKGIGPKNAIKLVKQYGTDFKSLFAHVKWDEHFDFGWEDVYYTFKKMPVTDEYDLKFTSPNFAKIKELLCEKHDFEVSRVDGTLAKIKKSLNMGQRGLGDFF